jgi:hypothetical protein
MTISPSNLTHKRISILGKSKKMSILKTKNDEMLIGVQIAALLKRETFNMYRSMKSKNIPLRKATAEEVEFLCNHNAVRHGTHSVTLIPYEKGLYFIGGT